MVSMQLIRLLNMIYIAIPIINKHTNAINITVTHVINSPMILSLFELILIYLLMYVYNNIPL